MHTLAWIASETPVALDPRMLSPFTSRWVRPTTKKTYIASNRPWVSPELLSKEGQANWLAELAGGAKQAGGQLNRIVVSYLIVYKKLEIVLPAHC